jgi:hypothetical protein
LRWTGARREGARRGAPDLSLGSYPQWDRLLDHRLQVTVEGTSAEREEAVVAEFLGMLPPGALVRST